MANFTNRPILTQRYNRVVQFAIAEHRSQVRKDGAPYLMHLQAVAALVGESGGSEIEICAAWLHDYPEDAAPHNGLTVEEGLERVADLFGGDIAAIVRGCTELDKEKASWEERKLAYIEQIKNGSEGVAIVSFCDKFHNLCAYCRGARKGDVNASQDPTKRSRTWWFLHQVLEAYRSHARCHQSILFEEYSNKLEELKHLWEL